MLSACCGSRHSQTEERYKGSLWGRVPRRWDEDSLMQKIVTATPCSAAAFCGETAAEPASAILATLTCMPLPIHPLPIVERWSCHQCGVCCRGSIVPLSAGDV